MAVGQANIEAFGQAELLYEALHEATQSNLPEMQPELTADNLQGGFTYTRADGTVERARSAEEAIKACPVLGRLALLDPMAAKMLLEVSSIGAAKIADATKQARPQEPKQPKPVPAKTMKSNEPVQEAQSPEKTSRVPRPTVPERAAATQKARQSEEQLRVAPAADGELSAAIALKLQQEARLAEVLQAAQQTSREQAERGHVEPSQRASRVPEAPVLEMVQADRPVRIEVARREQPVESRHVPAVEVAEQLAHMDYAAEDSIDKAPEIPERTVETTDASSTAIKEKIQVPEHSIEAETVRQEDEVLRSPDERCEEFAEALQRIAAAPVEPSASASEDTGTELFQTHDSEQSGEQPMPAIVVTVAEQLAQLEHEEKATIAPFLQDMLSLSLTIQQLKTQGAEKQSIDAQEKRLAEVVTTFFEAAGTHCEDKDVQIFIDAILQPEFQPAQPTNDATDIDLEYTGTREAKYHFPKLTIDLVALEDKLRQALGTVALLNVRAKATLGTVQ